MSALERIHGDEIPDQAAQAEIANSLLRWAVEKRWPDRVLSFLPQSGALASSEDPELLEVIVTVYPTVPLPLGGDDPTIVFGRVQWNPTTWSTHRLDVQIVELLDELEPMVQSAQMRAEAALAS